MTAILNWCGATFKKYTFGVATPEETGIELSVLNRSLESMPKSEDSSREIKAVVLHPNANAKVKRTILKTLGVLGTVFGIGCIIASVLLIIYLGSFATFGAMFLMTSLMPIGLLIIMGSLASLFYTFIEAPHTNPTELEIERFRERAKSLSFSELLRKHPLDFIRSYQIVPEDELHNKFREECKKLSFSEISWRYPTIFENRFEFEYLKGKWFEEMKTLTASEYFAVRRSAQWIEARGFTFPNLNLDKAFKDAITALI